MSAITATILIDGKWSATESVFAVRDPATLEEFASCADAGPVQARDSVDAAARAFRQWTGAATGREAAIGW